MSNLKASLIAKCIIGKSKLTPFIPIEEVEVREMENHTIQYDKISNRVGINSDKELDEILEGLARRITNKQGCCVKKSLNKCCRDPRLLSRTVVEASGLEELEDYMRKCRVLFVNTYTTHCPYCMMFEEVFHIVAEEFKGKAGFVRVNLERDPRVAYKYYIMGTPTTIVIVDGKPVDLIVGYVDDYTFARYVESLLKKYNCS